MDRANRLVTETKHALKTTEFWTMLALVAGILISAAVIKGGDNGTDEFIARQAWLYVAILGGAYFVGRGLAKSGSSEPYWREGTNEDRDTNGSREGARDGDRIAVGR
jgi:hypothetical protein